MKYGEREKSRIKTEYEPVQPTNAQSTAVPATRARKPSLDDMGPGTDRPVPRREAASGQATAAANRAPAEPSGGDSLRSDGVSAKAPRRPDVDPRTKAGAYGEGVRGPHKPTLDEMGPHALTPPRQGGKPLPAKPVLTREFDDPAEKGKRRGRPKKTGRPGA